MSEVRVEYTGLRRWQREVLQAARRHNVLVVHRRAGKTVLAILWLLQRVMGLPQGRGAYVAPLRNQAQRVAWDYLRRYTSGIPGAVLNQQELSVTLGGGPKVYLLGADNPHAIRGVGLDAVVMDEVAQMPASVWSEVIRPALADRAGASMHIGTPCGSTDQFATMYRDAEGLADWYRVLLTVEDTGVIEAGEMEALKREMREEEYSQEFLCDWSAAIRGAFWGKEMAVVERTGRVGNVPHDPMLPVHTAWDLGIRDSLVVWLLQAAGSEVRAIGCRAYQSSSLADVVRDLRSLPYTWGMHYLPHDARVRELGTGRTRVEMLTSLGLTPSVVNLHSVADGIEAVRQLLPRMWFDRLACGDGVEALKTYRTEWDDVLRVYRKQPLHSWESHYADALRQFAMGGQGAMREVGQVQYQDRVVA